MDEIGVPMRIEYRWRYDHGWRRKHHRRGRFTNRRCGRYHHGRKGRRHNYERRAADYDRRRQRDRQADAHTDACLGGRDSSQENR